MSTNSENLVQPPDARGEDFQEEPQRLSVFELGNYKFAVDIRSLREVVPLPAYTPLPNSNEIYLGVFPLRGEIFPLVDISPILALPPKQIWSDDMVMLLQKEEIVVGVLVDKIHSLVSYLPSQVKKPTSLVSEPLRSFLQGLIEINSDLVYILDAGQILQHEKVLAHYS